MPLVKQLGGQPADHVLEGGHQGRGRPAQLYRPTDVGAWLGPAHKWNRLVGLTFSLSPSFALLPFIVSLSRSLVARVRARVPASVASVRVRARAACGSLGHLARMVHARAASHAEHPQIANNASLLGIHNFTPRRQEGVRDNFLT